MKNRVIARKLIMPEKIKIEGREDYYSDLEWHCPHCNVPVHYDQERFLKNFVLWNTCSWCGNRYSVEME